MNHKLEQIYKQIPESTCPEHCGECCGILYPSMAEIRNVKDWLALHHREYINFTMVFKDQCPYLGTDKECTIYPVRPFLCRIMGVSEDIPCPLKKCQPKKMLNHAQSNWCYKQIYLCGKEKSRAEKHRKEVHDLFIQQGILVKKQ